MLKYMPPVRQNFFCDNWPIAKEILDDIKTYYPNIFVKMAASMLMRLGTKAYNKFCTTHES